MGEKDTDGVVDHGVSHGRLLNSEITANLGGSSSVSRNLAWELEGGQFKSSYRPQYGSGLVAEDVPVHFLGYCRGALEQGTKPPMCAPRELT